MASLDELLAPLRAERDVMLEQAESAARRGRVLAEAIVAVEAAFDVAPPLPPAPVKPAVKETRPKPAKPDGRRAAAQRAAAERASCECGWTGSRLGLGPHSRHCPIKKAQRAGQPTPPVRGVFTLEDAEQAIAAAS